MKYYSNTSVRTKLKVVRVTEFYTPLGYLCISFTIGTPPCQGAFEQKRAAIADFLAHAASCLLKPITF